MPISLRSQLLLTVLAVVSQQAPAQTRALPLLDGVYVGAEGVQAQMTTPPGETITVNRNGEPRAAPQLTILSSGPNSFKLVYRRTPLAIEWEGHGSFAPGCKCIRVVYSYTSNSGQNHGIGTLHLEVRDSGKIAISRSGWGVSDSSIRMISTLTRAN